MRKKGGAYNVNVFKLFSHNSNSNKSVSSFKWIEREYTEENDVNCKVS